MSADVIAQGMAAKALGGLGVPTATIPVSSAIGTTVAILPAGYTYSLTDNAGSKVQLATRTVTLAAAASATVSSYLFVVQAVPVNGGLIISQAIKVQLTAIAAGGATSHVLTEDNFILLLESGDFLTQE